MKAIRDTLRRCTAFADRMLNEHPVWTLILLIVFIGLAPNAMTSNQLNIAILIGMYAIAASGLNLTVGVTGLLDLGFVGFMAVGAYTVAILTATPAPDTIGFGWSFWPALIAAAAHAGFWGIMRGAPTLRLTGDYFAIVTFGFAELVRLAIKNKPLATMTRGARGFPGIDGPSIAGHEFGINPPTEYWYLVATVLVVVMFGVRRLVFSRVGRAWMAIREDETAAVALGVNVQRYKTYTFAISAGLGGLAGGFYASYLQNLHPDSFRFLESVWVLCMVVIGGMGSITGPLLGAIIFMSIREVLRDVVGEFSLPPDALYLVFGLALVLIMRFRPEGLVSTRSMRAELHPPETG